MTNPVEVITYSLTTVGGKPMRMSRRTAAHLDYTTQRLAKRHPAARMVFFQGTYNTTVAASKGTHDKDCAFDVQIIGLTWMEAQRFLRSCGWAAWFRAELWRGDVRVWGNHIHMISLGYKKYGIPVGTLIPGQVSDYYAHKSGLAGHAHDPTWHPADIDATVFDFEEWERQVGYSDWTSEDKAQFWADFGTHVTSALKEVPGAVWAFAVRTDPKLTARAAVRETYKMVEKIKQKVDTL